MDNFDKMLKNAMQDPNHLEQSPSLSLGEKARILQLTMNNIAEEIKIENKGVIKMKKYRRKLPIILAAALGVSIVSVSAATYFHMKAPLAQTLQTTPSEAATIPIGGTDLISSDFQNDVKIQALQVIGDHYGFYVLLELTSPSFTDEKIDFEDAMVTIDGVDTLYWDLKPVSYEDHTVAAILNVRTPDDVVGKTIDLSLEKLKTEKTTIPGKWHLSWDLDYEDVSEEYGVGQLIDLYGGKATLDSIFVSPLSVYVKLTEEEPFNTYGEFNDAITVKLKDGTVITSNPDNTYNDTTVIGLYLGKLIDSSQIESVTFAGVEVTMNTDFKVADNGIGKILIVSNTPHENELNKLLKAESDAFIAHLGASNDDQVDMAITYDYQLPYERFTVNYTATVTHADQTTTSYNALSDFNLTNGTRNNSADGIDLSIITNAIANNRYELKTQDNKLAKEQKDYLSALPSSTIDTLFNSINFTEANGSLVYPTTFMLANDDTMLVSIPAPSKLGDHIEFVVSPE